MFNTEFAQKFKFYCGFLLADFLNSYILCNKIKKIFWNLSFNYTKSIEMTMHLKKKTQVLKKEKVVEKK